MRVARGLDQFKLVDSDFRTTMSVHHRPTGRRSFETEGVARAHGESS
jgi:hypothetical protein